MGVLTKNGGSRSEGWLLSTILIVAISLTLAPVLRLFVEGVTDQGAVGLSLAGEVLRQPSTLSALKHSLVTAGFGTLVSVVLGSAFAFMVALTDLRAKAALVFCLMIPMMIPPQITALSWTQIMGPSSVLLKTLGLALPLGSPQPLYSAQGIILLLGIQHMSIIFLTLRAGLRAIPQEVVEAARISGARGLRTWWQVVMPLPCPVWPRERRSPLSPPLATLAFPRCWVFRRAMRPCRHWFTKSWRAWAPACWPRYRFSPC